jgi:hypothetical protein
MLWVREKGKALLYNLDIMHFPCTRCKGGTMWTLWNVKIHLLRNGRHPLFKVWRGLGSRDSSNEEWEEELRKSAIEC